MNTTKILAPMPGTIIEILTKVGLQVKLDEELIILEAMKMENVILSPIDGLIKEIKVIKGEKVTTDQVLIILEEIN